MREEGRRNGKLFFRGPLGPAKDQIALDFGQPMAWKDEMKRYISLDDLAAPSRTGAASGNVITLELTAPSNV